MNEEVKKAKEPKEAVSIIKKYEELLKGENRKTINIVGKQGELLKKLRRAMNSIFVLASADLIFISRLPYTYFCVNFPY